MSLAEDFLKQVGPEGMPPQVDRSLVGTWDVYINNQPKDEDRILSTLGFFHLIRKAGMKRMLDYKDLPEDVYKSIRTEQFEDLAKKITRLFAGYRLFDVLRVWKSKFSLCTPVRGSSRTFRFDLCLEPKKSEHLDGVLAKLQGTLYRDELPKQFREEWKKIPVSSKAKPKSALPKYTKIIGSDSVFGYLPLHTDIKSGFSVLGVRCAGDMLIIRLLVEVPAKVPYWSTPRKHDELLKTLFTKSLAKVKP